MKTDIITINEIELYHYTSEYGGKIQCVETGESFEEVYIPTTVERTYIELTDAEISDSEALKIITEGE